MFYRHLRPQSARNARGNIASTERMYTFLALNLILLVSDFYLEENSIAKEASLS